MRRAFWIFCSLTIGAVILFLSLAPVVRFTGGTDKLAHAASYGIWTAVSLMVFRRWIATIAVLILALAVGVGIEFVQPYIGRVCDVWDMAANAVGMVLGALFAFFILRPMEKWFLSLFAKSEQTEE